MRYVRKEVKCYVEEVCKKLRPYTIDGEIDVYKNKHIKVKGKYPSGEKSFILASSPSDVKWMLRSKTLLKRFIRTQVLCPVAV